MRMQGPHARRAPLQRCMGCGDMRANTNVAMKKRYTATLGGFKGVDLSSSPLNVAPSRATSMRNFINEGGVSRKRKGWRQIFSCSGRINGIFRIPGENGVIVHAGTSFYKFIYTDGKWESKFFYGTCETDTRSYAFYNGGNLYIVGCGSILVLSNGNHMESVWSLASTSPGYNYTPTTTISIDADGVVDLHRATLEGVNLLSPWRKNTLVGNSSLSSTFQLDGNPVISDHIYREVHVSGEVLFKHKDGNKTARWTFSTYVGAYEDEDKDHMYTATATDGTVIDYTWFAGAAFGDIDFHPTVTRDGKIHFKFPTAGVVEGASNITVGFYVNIFEEHSKLAGCTVASAFGAQGENERLFLGGNPDDPAREYWSEAGDFSYIPDTNSMYVGGNESSIIGYAKLSDDVQAVFKGGAKREGAVYYRTAVKTTITDADGDAVPATYFPVTEGMINEGPITPHAIANLWGDTVFLSKNGVFGVELSSNVSSGERYARERSRTIYTELQKKDLSDAAAIVHQGRYYIATGDGMCYVADARHKTAVEGSLDTNYEWWVWDNVPARCFGVLDNMLLFGDDQGRVCVFDDEFSDRSTISLSLGEIGLAQGEDVLSYGNTLDLKNAQSIKISSLTGRVCGLLLDNVAVRDGRCLFGKELLERIFDGIEVLADNVGNSGLAVDKTYEITDMDRADLSFLLKDPATGETVLPSCRGFRLCVPLNGKECNILSVDEEKHEITLRWPNSGKMELFWYNGVSSSMSGKVTHAAPVVASWVSPVMDMGTSMARKTLLAMSVVSEPGVAGVVKCGYETAQLESCLFATGGQPFSLETLDFANFSFDTGFAQSFTKRLNVRNFNYIVFRIYSDTATDCAVNSITVEYKINQTNRGVY